MARSPGAAPPRRARPRDVPVVLGDVTDDGALEAARAHRADGRLALTGSDTTDLEATLAARSPKATDVVTIGVGGNSLPFGDVLTRCLALGTAGKSCEEHYTDPPEGEESIQEKLDRVQDEYVEMPAAVHNAAPNAKVITVGYPAVLPEEGSACDRGALTELGTVGQADVDWLRDGVLRQLNATIQRVTQFFGDRYVDVYSSSVGHDACRPAEEKWVEGICGDAGDYWPARVGALDCAVVGKRATLLHPNAAGHDNTAAHVERAIRIALLDR
ncbi:GDSL-type esterase/lipase family protein [Streptomyces sp. NPDC015232]|uniref:GDSL-type esterase/lipase family protein n=1 Tax=unclassified Streptomyces TaxID=2593676 RepID=UPI0037008432